MATMKTLRKFLATSFQFQATHSRDVILLWSGLLFFIFPLAGEVIVWMSFHGFGLSLAQERVWPRADQYGIYAVILLPQVFSYLLVRRLGHPLLSQLWLYWIVAGTIGIGSGPFLARFDSMSSFQWGITVVSAVSMFALVWFAREVSAVSFRHSLLFVCLATAVHVPGSFIPPQFLAGPSFASPLPSYLILLVGGVLLKGTAVWALVKSRQVVSSTRTVLPTVVAVLLVGSAFTPLLPSFWNHLHQVSWILGVLSVGASALMYSALVIAIAYAVRIRESRSPVPATSHSA